MARLSIRRVYPEDEGEYTCVAYNELGSDSTSACLVVDGNLFFSLSLFRLIFSFCWLTFGWLFIAVADDKENDLMVQLDSRPAGTVSARATPRTTPRTTPSRTLRSLSPINSSLSNSFFIFSSFHLLFIAYINLTILSI